MDSDSDGSHDQEGDNDDDKSDHLVTVKPHFEGKAGEQVFLTLLADFFCYMRLAIVCRTVRMDVRYHRYCILHEINTKLL